MLFYINILNLFFYVILCYFLLFFGFISFICFNCFLIFSFHFISFHFTFCPFVRTFVNYVSLIMLPTVGGNRATNRGRNTPIHSTRNHQQPPLLLPGRLLVLRCVVIWAPHPNYALQRIIHSRASGVYP